MPVRRLNRQREALKRQEDHTFQASASYSSPPMKHQANEAGWEQMNEGEGEKIGT